MTLEWIFKFSCFHVLMLALTMFGSQNGYCQKEGNIWYFGEHAGLDFNGTSPISITDGQLYTFEGCASICNDKGQLQFYTDGLEVWNKNHSVMLNGSGLLGHKSSSQSAVIVKKPGSTCLYYIFTVTAEIGASGFNYSIVNMSQHGGLGAVSQMKNVHLADSLCEKIAVARHKNEIDFWIIVRLFGSNTYNSYKLTCRGLEEVPVISNVGVVVDDRKINSYGYLKASHNGTRIAVVHTGLHVIELFDFDNNSGMLTNPMRLNRDSAWLMPYGIEFSPSGSLLYVSCHLLPATIFQYNLLAGSDFEIDSSRCFITGSGLGGALQLGPDQKIYHAIYRHDSLGVINNPNSIGALCNYNAHGIYLNGKESMLGLPPIYYSEKEDYTMIKFEGLCIYDSTIFSLDVCNIDSLSWNFNDPTSGVHNFSTELNPFHVFSSAGTYQVTVSYWDDGFLCTSSVDVIIQPLPDVDLGEDQLFCENEKIILEISSGDSLRYSWSNGSTESSVEIDSPGIYWVDVYHNSCINSDTIEITIDCCDKYIVMPNVFTPNNDGFNDSFIPIKMGSSEVGDIEIYNRWGGIVYSSNSIKPGWDGRIQDNECSSGVYFWVIHFFDSNGKPHDCNGTITLIR